MTGRGKIYKQLIIAAIVSLGSFVGNAQPTTPWSQYVDRLDAFGKMIPQEKVYIHLDNTCYFLGELIYFKAYVRQTNTNRPSHYSGTLYVELFNHDGYLMERQNVEIKEGEGDGCFELKADSTMFAGFYEIRAYTRWQLNWGETEHEHSPSCKSWFFNKTMYREFFRDYEKLYSRVFPVYDKPLELGEYDLDMTMRPLQRFYKEDTSLPKLTLSLFPEGGNLVAGAPNRVAFEAGRKDGQYVKGRVLLAGSSADDAGMPTQNRGRGVFEVTPAKGMEREVEFVTTEGERVKAKLPKAEEKGVALHVDREDDEWVIRSYVAGLSIDSLALTVMHEGKLHAFLPHGQMEGMEGNNAKVCRLKDEALEAGVHQVTVFDTQGRVWADRLFFVSKPELAQPNLTVTGLKESYEAFEKIELDVQSLLRDSTRLSLVVRDASRGTRGYDTGNILTEMLLASEIRGFVPDPGWYFEADDAEHRTALDLLMMTQGWRRFNWREMAVKGEWEPIHPIEKTPILLGAVHKYEAYEKYDPYLLPEIIESDTVLNVVKSAIRNTNGMMFRESATIVNNAGEATISLQSATATLLTDSSARRWGQT